MSESVCEVCGSDRQTSLRRFADARAVLCGACHKLAGRRFNTRRGRKRDRLVEVPSRRLWIDTLRAAWDGKACCFRCMLTGVRLAINDPQSPRYPTLEHGTPGVGHGGWLVVAAVINDMKSDLGLDEFRSIVPLLATALCGSERKAAAAKLETVLDRLKHYRRVVPAVSQNLTRAALKEAAGLRTK